MSVCPSKALQVQANFMAVTTAQPLRFGGAFHLCTAAACAGVPLCRIDMSSDVAQVSCALLLAAHGLLITKRV